MEEEIWKDVVGYEGLYAVSNVGNVRRINRTNRQNKHIELPSGLYLHSENMIPNDSGQGYYDVQLSKFDKIKHARVHRLVSEAFIPNPENKPYVNHLNGIRNDNRVENLEWCTAKENSRHAVDTGLYVGRKGEENPRSIFKDEDILWIRENCKSYKDYGWIAEKFNSVSGTIKGIYKNRCWKHLL